MRHNLIPLLIALTTLTACGDPEEPAQDSAEITTVRELADETYRILNKQRCREHFRCDAYFDINASRFPDEASCIAASSRPYDPDQDAVIAGVEQGRATFDGTGLRACLARGEAMLDALAPCALRDEPLYAAFSGCPAAITGIVQPGQRCVTHSDCAGDAYCNAPDIPTCYEESTCVAHSQTCPEPCGADAYCDGQLCVPYRTAGQSCEGEPCARGLGCRTTEVGDTISYTCTAYGTLDEADTCQGITLHDNLCKPGLACIDEAGAYRCVRPTLTPRGGACQPQTDLSGPTRCAPGLTCVRIAVVDDTLVGTCDDALPTDAPCRDTHECAPGLACVPSQEDSPSGTCQPLKAADTPCFRSDECLPDSRCDYIDDTNRRCAPIGPFICTP
jgi:hypothetical protein